MHFNSSLQSFHLIHQTVKCVLSSSTQEAHTEMLEVTFLWRAEHNYDILW